jgi:hypothetical protein
MPLRKGTYIKSTHIRIIKFRVDKESGERPGKRGKYKARVGRKEVQGVREKNLKRACLRCSLLKIKVCRFWKREGRRGGGEGGRREP